MSGGEARIAGCGWLVESLVFVVCFVGVQDSSSGPVLDGGAVHAEALREFVAEHREAGVTRFLWTYAPNDDKDGRFLSRATLDRYAPLLADLSRPDDEEEEVRDK